jgi:epoxyqueuosine reductase QueG
MEKDSAYMAGAGWIGRNSLLITPGRGSYQFIACILTDLEILRMLPSPPISAKAAINVWMPVPPAALLIAIP